MHTHTTPAMKPAIVESPSNSFSSMSAIELFTAVDTLISVKNTLRLTGNLASHMRADALQGFAEDFEDTVVSQLSTIERELVGRALTDHHLVIERRDVLDALTRHIHPSDERVAFERKCGGEHG
ncbi:MAG: hypothetical protein J0H80_02075 [Rhizobiales bacterium]|nr:hypothetical protein [Hyphomicrobiales bacterium]